MQVPTRARALLEVRGLMQEFSAGCARSTGGRFHPAGRRNPCAARRERRRQIHADQGRHRRLPARRRHRQARRRRGRAALGEGGGRCGHRHRLSGGQSAAEPLGGGKPLSRAAADAVRLGARRPRCAVAPPRCSRSSISISMSAEPLGSYSVAVQHIVAIARAVDLSARVLILDEPTASLDRHEVEILFAIMRELARRGIGIVFVTHFLDQVYAISDRITVLRNGRLVGERTTRRTAADRTDPHDARPRTRRSDQRRAQRRSVRQVGRDLRALRELWQGRLRRAVRSRTSQRRGGWPRRPARLGPHRNRAAGVRRRACRQRQRRPSTASRSGCNRRATPSPMASAIARKSARPRASLPISRCAKTSCWRCRPSAAWQGRCRAREQDEIADAFHQAARHPPAGSGTADRAVVRRQPAEGDAGALARHRAAPSDPRRADARHRCRRACRDHPTDPRTLRRRPGAAGDLLRARGDRRPIRSRSSCCATAPMSTSWKGEAIDVSSILRRSPSPAPPSAEAGQHEPTCDCCKRLAASRGSPQILALLVILRSTAPSRRNSSISGCRTAGCSAA